MSHCSATRVTIRTLLDRATARSALLARTASTAPNKTAPLAIIAPEIESHIISLLNSSQIITEENHSQICGGGGGKFWVEPSWLDGAVGGQTKECSGARERSGSSISNLGRSISDPIGSIRKLKGVGWEVSKSFLVTSLWSVLSCFSGLSIFANFVDLKVSTVTT